MTVRFVELQMSPQNAFFELIIFRKFKKHVFFELIIFRKFKKHVFWINYFPQIEEAH